MTARPGAHQTSWNAGEITPAALHSTQLKPYYSGAKVMRRLRPIPQGGCTLLPGSRHRATLGVADTPIRLIPFTWSRERAYVVVFAPGVISIYHASTGGYALSAALTSPYGAAQIATLTTARLDDTMLIFHPDVPPYRLVRLGLDAWSLDIAPWTGVPLVDYGGEYETVAEVWRIAVTVPTSDSSFSPDVARPMTMTVNGEKTTAVNFVFSDGPGSAALMQAAIAALPSIKPGVVVYYAEQPSAGLRYWQISFAGENAGGVYDVTASFADVKVAVTASRLVKGDPGGEAIMSDARGYPSCGIFYGGRLILAGFRSNPSAVLASRVAEYFDLNIKAAAASAATLLRMDVDGGERIVRLRRARHLVVMTTEAEWHMADRAISRDTPPNMVVSSRLGARLGTPALEQEGDLLFTNRAGTQILTAAYSEVGQGYAPTPISLLSTHLITGVIDLALQKGAAATDVDRLWVVNADGSLACGSILRDQEITGFTPWPTAGDPVRAVCVDGTGTPWIAVLRGGAMRIETLEDGLYFDGAVSIAQAASAVVPGLIHLEGRAIYLIADGYPEGPLTVAGGAVTLKYPAAAIVAGLWTPPRLEPLPLARDVGPRQVLKRPARVHTVKLDLAGAAHLAVAANGRPLREAPTTRAGDPPDTIVVFTGRLTVTGLQGFTPDTQVAIEQIRPGPFALQALTLEARI